MYRGIKDTVIWDLDGTLFNCDHRLHHIRRKNENESPDWKSFFAETLQDPLIEQSAIIYRLLMQAGYTPVILTGRPESNAKLTREQLRKVDLFYDTLCMRPDNCRLPSAQLKQGMVQQLRERGHNLVMAFEDEPNTIQMYQQEGIYTFACDGRNWANGTYKEVDVSK